MSSNKNDDNSSDDIINNDNINDNKSTLIKEFDEDICEICGESKQFHSIKELNSDNNNNIAKENIIFGDNLITKDNNNIISKENDEDEDINKNECQICLDELDNPVILENCQHQFCFECFHSYLVF